ncbi:MAG: DUF177 domain-containing protein [Bdellovibrionales bacterium]|nr:DUF177 domain-containing protein [Bdellovibrionales bacterium]
MAHQHLILNPVVINLKDLPTSGRTFKYNQASGELTSILKELIGSHVYDISISVKPAGNVYLVEGIIETKMDEICSLCALEFVQPLKQSFNEILVVKTKRDFEGQQSRVNHTSELNMEGPECTELESDDFNIGEYIRELIAISKPIKPVASSECGFSCENYQKAIANGWLTPENTFKRENPFGILEKLKLNS